MASESAQRDAANFFPKESESHLHDGFHGLILMTVFIVLIALTNDTTVFLGGVTPISYVTDDLLEGVTKCPMGISQLKMSGMSLKSAGLKMAYIPFHFVH